MDRARLVSSTTPYPAILIPLVSVKSARKAVDTVVPFLSLFIGYRTLGVLKKQIQLWNMPIYNTYAIRFRKITDEPPPQRPPPPCTVSGVRSADYGRLQNQLRKRKTQAPA